MGKTINKSLPRAPARQLREQDPDWRGGRPSLKTEETTRAILDRMADGELFKDICADIGISQRVVYNWRDRDQDFDYAFKIARQRQVETLAEGTLAKIDHHLRENDLSREQVGTLREYGTQLRWICERLHPSVFAPHPPTSAGVQVTIQTGLQWPDEPPSDGSYTIVEHKPREVPHG